MANLAGLALGSGTRPETIDWFKLDEGPFMPGFLGADYALKEAEAGLCHEEICLRLRGSHAEMSAIIRQLESALRGALLEKQAESAYLRLYSQTLAGYVYARVIQTQLAPLPGHISSKEVGSYCLKVNIVREARFVGDEVRLSIFNSGGTGDARGLTLYNHDDSHTGHDHWFSALTSGLGLSEPCPMRLEFYVPEGAVSIGDFHLGSFRISEAGSFPPMTLEAEQGIGGTTIADARASNGKFQRYSWSGSGWANLANWSLSSMLVSKLASQTVLPVLRLHNLTSQTGIRLRFILRQQGVKVYESPICSLQTGKSGQIFSPMHLGAGGLPGLNYAYGLNLSLEALQSESSASLDVDDIIFLPQKCYRFYQSLCGLEPRSSLIDESWREQTWSLKEEQELKTHLSLGRAMSLFPGLEQRFYLFMSSPAGLSAIDMTMKVRAWYRPVTVLP